MYPPDPTASEAPTPAAAYPFPPPPEPPSPPGLREQARRTIAAARRLVTAHVDLAKAEGGAIFSEAKRAAALAGVAIAALLFIALLVPIGTTLFVGEWLFGSIGWGILDGTLLAIAIAVVLVLAALRVRGSSIGGAFLGALILGIVAGVVLGLAWLNQAYASIGTSIVPGVDAGIRPLVVGTVLGAIVVGLLGLIGGARAGGGGGAVAGLVGGAVLGALLGAFTAISFSYRVGAALGVAVGLAAWPALAALALRSFDPADLKRRFMPQASIDAAKETMDFVKARMPRRKGDQA